MSHYHSSTSATNLYCAEDADGVVSWEAGNDDDDAWISSNHSASSSSSSSDDDDGFDISRVFESEPHHMPHPDYLSRCRDRSIDVTARQDSINWILKVWHYLFIYLLLSARNVCVRRDEEASIYDFSCVGLLFIRCTLIISSDP